MVGCCQDVGPTSTQKAPQMDWTGSGPILEEFWTTKKTVKYGQCWVFSGLVTTCKSMN